MLPPRAQTISDILRDKKNANRGTDRGAQTIKKSIEQFGVGRSVVTDKNGQIIAGNQTHKAAMAAGIKKIRVIETTGDELIVHQRTDLNLDTDAKARGLALTDNRSSQISQDMDMDVVREQIEEYHLDIETVGYTETELEVTEYQPPETEQANPPSGNQRVGELFMVIVTCTDDAHQRKAFKALSELGYDVKCQTL